MRDPWVRMEALAGDWSAALADACEARFTTADADGRKRLVWLLERVKANDVLLRRLVHSNDEEAAAILRALNGADTRVPSKEIRRLLDVASEEAVVAAGHADDASLVPLLVARLDDAALAWHAALSLARLGRREFAQAIADRIPRAKKLQPVGLLVALEAMNEPAVAPRLRAMLVDGAADLAWDLHHAIWRLTGREPLVPLVASRNHAARAYAEAWRAFDLEASTRPRREHLALDERHGVATFKRQDGSGRLCVDYDPPHGGGSWPRWNLSLYVGEKRLYAIGSHCGTCETTLRLLGFPSERAVADASAVRGAVKDVRALDVALLDALEPYFAAMRTGHYVVHLVDLPLERVTAPARSWLTRRAAFRVSDDEGEPGVGEEQWLGAEHFQTSAPPSAPGVPTFGVVVPTAPLAELNAPTVESHAEAIANGTRPAAIVVAWAETKEVEGEHAERFVIGAVLDGHHKLAAYARAGVAARCLLVTRVEDTWGPPDDRTAPLREALARLAQPVTT